MTHLLNGATYTNPYLSFENAEFLLSNNFSIEPMWEGRIAFRKKSLTVIVNDNCISVFMSLPNQTPRTHFHQGIDLPLIDFIALMRDLHIVDEPAKVRFTALVLDAMEYSPTEQWILN